MISKPLMKTKNSSRKAGRTASLIREELERTGTWLIISHHKPDGDTLGSASALFQMGKNLGKSVFWGGQDDIPEVYRFLKESSEYRRLERFPEGFCPSPGSAIICLDISNSKRSIPFVLNQKGPCRIINIDHHEDNEMYGDINFVDPGASSTGEILCSLFTIWNWPVTKDIADSIYTAVITDTGNFAYQNTHAGTFSTAAYAVDRGTSPSEIYEQVYHSQTIQGLRLWGRAFSRLREIYPDAVLTWVTIQDFRESGAHPSETENLINRIMQLKGIRFAILLVEEETQIRVSMRSRNWYVSAGQLAREFGGGGHPQAAGCRISLSLEEAKGELSRHLLAYIEEQ